jgi:hypothetical protein
MGTPLDSGRVPARNMSLSISNLLAFLEIAFADNSNRWDVHEIDEAAVRVVARRCSRSAQQALLAELEALLAGSASDTDLINVASKARVDHLVDKSTVREWFVMLRDQVRVVIAAAG